jgi:hypothetical protein
MQSNQAENLAQLQTLLREGKVTEADELITKQMVEAAAAARAAAGLPPEPAPPRPPQLVVYDLFDAIISHLGNHPLLLELLAELHALVYPKA